jgi:hypothetical protein
MNAQGFGNRNLRTAGSLLAFALVCLFALLSVLVVTTGLQAYEQIIRNAELNTQLRTSLNYTANKIRAHDGLGAVEAKLEGDIPTLALYETIEGDGYVTYIYCYGGMLYERFAPADSAFDPEQGEELVPMESFSATVDARGVTQLFEDLSGERYTQFTATISK